MDLKVARTKWKIQIAELEKWRDKAYHNATSESGSSNSS
jgi:hypothetical protein